MVSFGSQPIGSLHACDMRGASMPQSARVDYASARRGPAVVQPMWRGLRVLELDGDLVALAEISLDAVETRFGELEIGDGAVGRAIPHLGLPELDADDHQVRVVGSAQPPVLLPVPKPLGAIGIVDHEGLARDREIDVLIGVDEGEVNLRADLDLVLSQTAPVREEADHVVVPLRQCLHGPNAHAVGELHRHHADARLLDDLPDPIDACFVVDAFLVVYGHWEQTPVCDGSFTLRARAARSPAILSLVVNVWLRETSLSCETGAPSRKLTVTTPYRRKLCGARPDRASRRRSAPSRIRGPRWRSSQGRPTSPHASGRRAGPEDWDRRVRPTKPLVSCSTGPAPVRNRGIRRPRRSATDRPSRVRGRRSGTLRGRPRPRRP